MVWMAVLGWGLGTGGGGRPVSFLVATMGLQSFMSMLSTPAPC